MSSIPVAEGSATTTLEALQDFGRTHRRLLVLTGAGCSTDSGIPDYRSRDGEWKRPAPVTYQSFMGELRTRQRYWARSMVGWPTIAYAQPNAAHRALAELEARGRVELLVTQNVDGLHNAAGSVRTLDLHGRLDVVRCMACEARIPRDEHSAALREHNLGWTAQVPEGLRVAPDGDADLEGVEFASFNVPACPRCGVGVLKPDVVFYGESVPRERVAAVHQALAQADALLVAGTSLMVYSGYRFALAAVAAGKPVVAINQGRTRADELYALKVEVPVALGLPALLHI